MESIAEFLKEGLLRIGIRRSPFVNTLLVDRL
jgi:hypothetical protein